MRRPGPASRDTTLEDSYVHIQNFLEHLGWRKVEIW